MNRGGMPTILMVALVALVAGCATDKVTYRIAGTNRDAPRVEAEQIMLTQRGVAGSTAALDAPLKAIATPFPEYPMSFRNANIVGRVRVRFTVEADGSVSNPSVIGSPPPPLVAITLNSIMRWRFEPPRRGGSPTQVTVQQEFVFNVE